MWIAGSRTELAVSQKIEDDNATLGDFGVVLFFSGRCGPVHIERQLESWLVPAMAAPFILFPLPDLLNYEGR
jgi:hypothetical protein